MRRELDDLVVEPSLDGLEFERRGARASLDGSAHAARFGIRGPATCVSQAPARGDELAADELCAGRQLARTDRRLGGAQAGLRAPVVQPAARRAAAPFGHDRCRQHRLALRTDDRRAERRLLVAAFNGGFKFDTNSGGFESYGRVGAPLSDGLGSIVTYSDGTTDIGAWHDGVPAHGKRVASVRQNLHLLIDGGRPAADTGCLLCWGATLGGVTAPARSALGITADGRLVWAGGEHLTVADLVDVLLRAHVVRAVELDINPEWVAGYLYGHRGGVGPLAPVPIAPGQPGVPGQFLAPYSRDFFTVVARR